MKKYIAECVGTFVLTVLGCGTAMFLGCGEPAGVVGTASAFGLAVGAMAYTMGNDYRLYRLGDDGRTIPKGTAVVVIATAPGVSLTPAGTNKLNNITVHGGKNILVGNDVATGYDSICVLSVDSAGEVGFFKLLNFTLPAFKAGYLPPVDGGLEDYERQNNQRW